MDDQKNLLIAVVLSVAVLLFFQMIFIEPEMEAERAAREAAEIAAGIDGSEAVPGATLPTPNGALPTPAGALPTPSGGATATVTTGVGADAAPDQRVTIDADRVLGSVNLTGALFDDLVLKDYFETIEDDSPNVRLLKGRNEVDAYFFEFGWQSGDGRLMPGPDTRWQAKGSVLTTDTPLELQWDNGEGLTFNRSISVDENFLFTITDRVVNTGTEAASLAPYATISQRTTPDVLDFFILHEGPMGVIQGSTEEVDYSDLRDDGNVVFQGSGGWIGFTGKYWLTAIAPSADENVNYQFAHSLDGGVDRYNLSYIDASFLSAPAGGEVSVTRRFYAGAKEVDLLDHYEETAGIEKFNLAIDWGWFWFLTQPLFQLLVWFNGLLGNFGLAILALTVVVKLIFFPLANKQYTSMSKMRKLNPKMVELRERFADDKPRQQQELMALYKKEKVNPAAGCLPILIQIPVFFALYKAMFVTIEMRHQPFFGWIHDLSAADPMVVTTLFGLIPWDPPGFLALGLWPLIMGASMYFQMKLNPQPQDPVQAKVFAFMPLFFMFILATFPAGLVIYWTWNNVLSMAQQWVIMRRMGVSLKDG